MRGFAFIQRVSGGVRQAAHNPAFFIVQLSPRAHQTFAATRAFIIVLMIHHYIFRHYRHER